MITAHETNEPRVFFSNIDWKSVEKRLQLREPAFVEASRG